MKKIYATILAIAAIIFASCNGKKEPVVNIVPVDELPSIIEAHGTIGEGTSMNMLEFINDDGDTVYINMSSQSIMGGEAAGDEIQVVYNTKADENIASIAVNLTSLQHLWAQIGSDGTEQSLELNSGGRASTYDMSIDYDSWEIRDGLLLLHSPKKLGDESPAIIDTFQIMELTDDNLVLMNGIFTTEFIREN